MHTALGSLAVATILLVPLVALSQKDAGSRGQRTPEQSTAAGVTLEGQAVTDLANASLEDLLNMKVEVATQTAVSMDAAPSIISVITRQEIDSYGFRTLFDILHVLPGFQFSYDVTGEVPPTLRGIWVEEGKLLLLINGMTINDLQFGGASEVYAMPTTFIERIEIIRGPGSARYGQFAEAGVINIITFKGKSLNGVRIEGALTTQAIKNTAYRLEASGGGAVGDVDVSATVGVSVDPWSSRIYNDFFGNSLQMGLDNSSTDYEHVVAQARYKGLSLRYRRQAVKYVAQDDFTTIQAPINGLNTEVTAPFIEGTALAYYFNPVAALTVDLHAEILRSTASEHAYYPGAAFATSGSPPSSGASGIFSVDYINQFIYDGRLTYDFAENGSLTAGGGFKRESIEGVTTTNQPALLRAIDPTKGFTDKKDLDTGYVMLEYLNMFPIDLGLTAGGRIEFTPFGNAFAPRVGLNYVRGDFSAKALYGNAFRIPTTWQAYSTQFSRAAFKPLVPETSNSYEVELAYRILEQLKVRANAFYIDVSKPLLYSAQQSTYTNATHIRTAGFEAEAQLRANDYTAFLNVSYAHPIKGTYAGYLTAEGDAFLGYAPLKIALGGFYRYKKLVVGPTLVIETSKQGQSSAYANATVQDPSAAFTNTTYPATALLNLNVRVDNVFDRAFPGVDFYISGYNLFDTRYQLVQGYYGQHAPMPFFDRQFLLGAVWHLDALAADAS